MKKIIHQVVTKDGPARFHSHKKVWKAFFGKDEPNQQHHPTNFGKPEWADQRAKQAGLEDYSIEPLEVDQGNPISLAEIGI